MNAVLALFPSPNLHAVQPWIGYPSVHTLPSKFHSSRHHCVV